MKESYRPLFFEAVILAGLAACSPQPPNLQSDPEIPILEVSFRVSAAVARVEDVANPSRSSDDPDFPEIPNYQSRDPKKGVIIPSSGFFQVQCEGRRIFQKEGSEVDVSTFSTQIPDDGDMAYLFPPSADDPRKFPLDYSRALAVDKRDFVGHAIRHWMIRIGEEKVDEQTFAEDIVAGMGPNAIIAAAKFPPARYQASCDFETFKGEVYTDTVIVEIVKETKV